MAVSPSVLQLIKDYKHVIQEVSSGVSAMEILALAYKYDDNLEANLEFLTDEEGEKND